MDGKEENGLLALNAVGILLGSLALMFMSMFYGGFVTMKLWNGIISPTFDFAQLNFFQGFGLDLFVSYLVYTSKSAGKREEESVFKLFIEATVSTTLFWGIGSLVMLFI